MMVRCNSHIWNSHIGGGSLKVDSIPIREAISLKKKKGLNMSIAQIGWTPPPLFWAVAEHFYA